MLTHNNNSLRYICNEVTILFRSQFISQQLSAVMLVVMLLSIMPKSYLHDVFADHSDTIVCNDFYQSGPCIHNQAPGCEQSEIVVPAVYILHPEQALGSQVEQTGAFCNSFYSYLLLKTFSSKTGRAPPCDV